LVERLADVLGEVAAGHVARGIPCRDVMVQKPLDQPVKERGVFRGMADEDTGMSGGHGSASKRRSESSLKERLKFIQRSREEIVAVRHAIVLVQLSQWRR